MDSKGLKERGAVDCKKNLPIDAYYQIKLPKFGLKRHTEAGRAAYEMGWRAQRAEWPRGFPFSL